MTAIRTLIFLLGGHDLEMREIARLLRQKEVSFFDRDLDWNRAKLSAYRVELQHYGNHPGRTIYGVELQDDANAERYANYVPIDHHGRLDTSPSALEQTAKLLGVTLTRRQQLIAANDSGYIPAMQRLGATPDEIEEIRAMDRSEQGVTADDERLAEESLRSFRREVDGVILVRSLTERFSPICDRLWPYDKLLIHTDRTFCYYGRGKERLVRAFGEEIAAGNIYSGGGENGFLGAAAGIYAPAEILRWVERCRSLIVDI